MKIKPWNHTMKEGHLSWSDFMVHGVNRPSDSTLGASVWQELKANTNVAYIICDLAYEILKA